MTEQQDAPLSPEIPTTNEAPLQKLTAVALPDSDLLVLGFIPPAAPVQAADRQSVPAFGEVRIDLDTPAPGAVVQSQQGAQHEQARARRPRLGAAADRVVDRADRVADGAWADLHLREAAVQLGQPVDRRVG